MFSRFVSKLIASVVIGSSAVAGAASAAHAYGTTAACTTRTESTAFSQWGDSASYFRAVNGGFENGTTDWGLTGGASIVTGDNEPWKVGGSTDAKSLKIPAGATAESRTMCVKISEDSIRLFVKNAHVGGSILHVTAKVRNPNTGQTAETSFDVNGDAAPTGWAPTMRLTIPNLLNGTSGSTQELTLQFSTRGTAATWSIDDLFVDPWKL